jgi:hypothetical protein
VVSNAPHPGNFGRSLKSLLGQGGGFVEIDETFVGAKLITIYTAPKPLPLARRPS